MQTSIFSTYSKYLLIMLRSFWYCWYLIVYYATNVRSTQPGRSCTNKHNGVPVKVNRHTIYSPAILYKMVSGRVLRKWRSAALMGLMAWKKLHIFYITLTHAHSYARIVLRSSSWFHKFFSKIMQISLQRLIYAFLVQSTKYLKSHTVSRNMTRAMPAIDHA